MGIREDEWLSVRFGHPVFTIEPETDPATVSAHMAEQSLASYQAKVPTAQVNVLRGLCRCGLYVVDANVTLARRPSAGAPAASCEVVVARPEHAPAVTEIARTAFDSSRFHLDPAIPDETANRIKGDWVQSYFSRARGEKLLVALVAGTPAGFLAILAGDDHGRPVRVIDLVAVDRAHQGGGIGSDLTWAFMRDSADVCEIVEVGTQLANVRATAMYETLGFETVRTQYVLHGHVSA